MNKLIFLTSNAMSPRTIKAARIPLQFISFGYAEGRLATKHRELDDTILIYKPKEQPLYGDIAYGALFVLEDYEFHIPVLDALMGCTEAITAGLYQHVNIRVDVNVVPIAFNSLDEFRRLIYTEKDLISATTYYANPNHITIINRIKTLKKYTNVSNINPKPFRELYEEVYPAE